jgi:hypothetical protein
MRSGIDTGAKLLLNRYLGCLSVKGATMIGCIRIRERSNIVGTQMASIRQRPARWIRQINASTASSTCLQALSVFLTGSPARLPSGAMV